MEKIREKMFPVGFADSFLSSKYPKILKCNRLLSSLFFIGCTLLYLILRGPIILQYLTIQTLILNTVYFTLAFICYFVSKLKEICSILFEIVWCLNWIVTVAYWGYLSDFTYSVSEVMGDIIPHSTPFLMTMVDFVLNEVTFYRIHNLIAIVYLIFYTFCVLLPCTLTLGIVYHGITFKNWFTYVFIFVLLLFGLLTLEAGKRIKDKFKCFKSQNIENQKGLILSVMSN